MAGKSLFKNAEMRYYINARVKLGESAINIYFVICDIYDNNEVS